MRLRTEKYMKAKLRKALVLLTRQRCMWVVVLILSVWWVREASAAD